MASPSFAVSNSWRRSWSNAIVLSRSRFLGMIPSGSSLSLRSNARVCTNTYQPGQTFSATTTSAVSGSNGATIPAGATVQLEVTQLKRSENMNDKIVMEFAVKSVSFGGRTYPVSGSVADAIKWATDQLKPIYEKNRTSLTPLPNVTPVR